MTEVTRVQAVHSLDKLYLLINIGSYPIYFEHYYAQDKNT